MKLKEKKSDIELERKIKSYLLEEQHENFLAAVRKWEILAATKVKMSEWKKVNNNKYDISSVKRVTRKFLEVSRCGRSKQRQSNLVSRASTTWFYILFEQTINIIESFAFSPG